MAKQPVSIVERHVEKGILGITATVLLAAVGFFLVSTPNKIELGAGTVGPNTIDERLREAGDQLRDKLRRAPVPEIEVIDRVPLLDEAASPLTYAGVGPQLPASPWLPPVPVLRDEVPMAGEIKLAEVIAPGRPLITFGRATLELPPPEIIDPKKPEPDLTIPLLVRGPFETDTNWITVAALFDQQRQIEVAKRAGYRINKRNPYVVGVDLQRRQMLSDGTSTDWTDVTLYAPRKLQDLPKIEITSGPGGSAVTQSTRDDVRSFFKLLKSVQSELHRPLFPRRVFGDDWRYPEFPNIAVEELDRELCPECVERKYGFEVMVEDTSAVLGARERIKKMLEEAERFIKARQCEAGKARAEKVLIDPEVRRDEVRKAQEFVNASEQCKRDRDRDRNRPGAPGGVDDDDGPQEIRRSPYQVVWANDVAAPADGGALSGRTYQYRIRVRLYNTYSAVVGDLADSADAAKVAVPGAWSEPSDDVHIPADTAFFLTSGNPFNESGAKATIYRWFEGVWVGHAFPMTVGQPITGMARETVRQARGGQADRPMIDFDTGATVVDIDYHYTSRTRKSRGKGHRILAPKRTVALVYSDASGVLHQRVLAADKASADYKRYRDGVFRINALRR